MSGALPRLSFLLLGIVVVAWFGLEAGRKHSSSIQEVESADLHGTTLRIDHTFPDVTFVGAGGRTSSARDWVGRPTLVCLMAVGCDPCSKSTELLREAASTFPDDLRVVGVGFQDYNELVDHQVGTGFPYDVYAEPARRLVHEYGCKRFPAAIGVRADGRIAFVMEGLNGFARALDSLGELSANPSAAVSYRGASSKP